MGSGSRSYWCRWRMPPESYDRLTASQDQGVSHTLRIWRFFLGCKGLSLSSPFVVLPLLSSSRGTKPEQERFSHSLITDSYALDDRHGLSPGSSETIAQLRFRPLSNREHVSTDAIKQLVARHCVVLYRRIADPGITDSPSEALDRNADALGGDRQRRTRPIVH